MDAAVMVLAGDRRALAMDREQLIERMRSEASATALRRVRPVEGEPAAAMGGASEGRFGPAELPALRPGDEAQRPGAADQRLRRGAGHGEANPVVVHRLQGGFFPRWMK